MTEHPLPQQATADRDWSVVLIESSQLSRAFLSRHFSALGFRCIEAGSRDDALGLILGGRPDLVCTNAWIGATDTLDFVSELRTADFRAPILLLTARTGDDFRAEAREAGVTGVVEKRSGDELASRITEFVRHHVQRAPHRGRVLYVEDSRTESTWFQARLTGMGLEVDHFVTAEGALQALDEQDGYDLIITDVLLKGRLSGLDLIGRVRQMPEPRSRLPILTVTGFDDATRRIELLRAGTTDYVVKPVLADELSVRVNNLISNKHLIDRVIQQQAQLREMAMTDQLTGCANRRGLRDQVGRLLALRERRRNPGRTVRDALIMLDLDHFKQLNDAHGHAAGDDVLSTVGALLRSFLRKTDIACRTGGEEFLLYLSDVQHVRVRSVAERLRHAIRSLRPNGLEITASIGATTFEPQRIDDLDHALHCADEALYRAKHRGRDRVVVRKTPAQVAESGPKHSAG